MAGLFQTRRLRARLFLMSGVAVVAAGMSPAMAQEAESAPDDGEIVVTAQKRSESLKDIPISINAFDGNRLEEAGIKNVEDVQFLAAGLQFGHERSGGLQVSIRGISSNVGLETAVAVHQDGIYLGQRQDQSRAYFDIERIEVLRGPQGTLYGRNATGGALNIITREPTGTASAGAKITVGNYNLIEGEGYASGPLADGLNARIAVKSSSLPGYGRNLFTRDRANGEDSTSVRVKLNWEATERLTLKLTGDYSNTFSTYDDEISRLFPTTPLSTETGGFVPPTGFDTNTNYPDEQRTKIFGVSLRGELDLGFATLSSLTGYRKLDRSSRIDIDSSPQDRAYFRFGDTANKQFSQELNLASAGGGRFNWLLGAFYFYNHNFQDREVVLTQVGGTRITNRVDPYKTNAVAAFGEGSYEITDALKLTVGARYSIETSQLDEYRTLGPTSGEIHAKGTWRSFTPKAALSLALSPRTTAYATISRGFKSGGFNPSTFIAESFRPEQVTNYEVGIKGSTPGGVFRGGLSAFYMDYSDLQVATLVLRDGVPASRIVNAASATIKGIEADFQVQPTDWFGLDGNISLLDATYDDFFTADATIPPPPGGPPPVNGNRDVSGNRMVNAPPFAANVGVTFESDIASDWHARLRGEMSYQDKVYFTPLEDFRGISQDSYALFNARVEFANKDAGWTVAFYVRNIADKRVASRIGEVSDAPYTGLHRQTTYKPPRTYGVTVGYSF